MEALSVQLGGAIALPARQEARDLIAAVLDVPRFWPSAHPEHALSRDELAAIEDAAARMARGMPFAYAVRRAAFRSLSLFVDERVLIPRPETEVLVDLVLAATEGGRGTVIDVGTGSGCIALALASEGKFSRVIGTDVSAGAIAVATFNSGLLRRHGERQLASSERQFVGGVPEFRLGSYLSPCFGEKATVVVSNPPYISYDEAKELPSLVRDWEPSVALFADGDGLTGIAEIATQAAGVLNPGGLLALEVDSRRAGRASELVAALAAYRDVLVRPDLTGRARFVLARRAED
jgi:release factor glutamine methyltransferase